MSVIEIGKRVPAADGTSLATDIARPGGPGPFPVILVRTCYHRKDAFANNSGNNYLRFVERGYAVVIQDVRGKFDSEGEFNPIAQEADDGHATIDWIANQRWCNGRIGMWGRSYLGMVQTPAASRQHPALRAIAPSVPPTTRTTRSGPRAITGHCTTR